MNIFHGKFIQNLPKNKPIEKNLVGLIIMRMVDGDNDGTNLWFIGAPNNSKLIETITHPK